MFKSPSRLIRVAVGGCMALLLFFLVILVLNSVSISGGGGVAAHISLASHSTIARFGSYPLAVAMELVSLFALGAALGLSTMPFADDTRILIGQSLLHFLFTGALVLFSGWVFCFFDLDYGWLCFLGLYVLLYLLIWMGRWIGWYVEVRRIRARLGLTPPPPRWRTALPYLPLLLVLCVALPPVLMLADRLLFAPAPLLSGVVLPFLIHPVVGFCSGLSLGKRQGLCLTYPLAAFVLLLPAVFLLYNSSALFHVFLLSGPALAGNALGAVWRRYRKSKEGSV